MALSSSMQRWRLGNLRDPGPPLLILRGTADFVHRGPSWGWEQESESALTCSSLKMCWVK